MPTLKSQVGRPRSAAIECMEVGEVKDYFFHSLEELQRFRKNCYENARNRKWTLRTNSDRVIILLKVERLK